MAKSKGHDKNEHQAEHNAKDRETLPEAIGTSARRGLPLLWKRCHENDGERQARCNSGRSVRMSFTVSSDKTVSMSRLVLSAPRKGCIRSRALPITPSRVIGFSGVPRTASTLWLSCLPFVKVTATTVTRFG